MRAATGSIDLRSPSRSSPSKYYHTNADARCARSAASPRRNPAIAAGSHDLMASHHAKTCRRQLNHSSLLNGVVLDRSIAYSSSSSLCFGLLASNNFSIAGSTPPPFATNRRQRNNQRRSNRESFIRIPAIFFHHIRVFRPKCFRYLSVASPITSIARTQARLSTAFLANSSAEIRNKNHAKTRFVPNVPEKVLGEVDILTRYSSRRFCSSDPL